jgi:Ca-activated chloride channel homolog
MQPQIRLDRSIVVDAIGDVVHLLIEMVAPPAPVQERRPLDLVVVLDRSGSMGGKPLAAVTEATASLLRLMGPDDRIGVVSFDDDVDLVLPLARHGDVPAAARAIGGIRAGGSTNLSGGWLKGFELLAADRRPEALRRLVVLTDGHANAGLTGIDRLAPLVSGGRGEGVTTSFIGFADGFDEELLSGLADAGGGNDYWCAGADQAAAVFTAEFDGLATVVAQNISVEIVPSPAVAVVGVLNDFPVTSLPSGGVQVAVGDAFGDERRSVVAACHLRPLGTAMAPGAVVDVANVTLRWASTTGDVALHMVTLPVTVTVGAAGQADPGADPRVTEEVLVLAAARARREARHAADRGDLQGASTHLRVVADQLAEACVAPSEVEALRNEIAALEDGEWSAVSSKRMHSTAKSMNRKRRSNFDATPPDEDDESGF